MSPLAQTLHVHPVQAHAAALVPRAAVGVLIALVFAVIAQRYGQGAVRWLLPAMQAQLQDFLPEFRISSFLIDEAAGQPQLDAQVLLSRPLQIGHRVVDQVVLANAALTLGAFWQPVAVAIATAAVWPTKLRHALRERTAAVPGWRENATAWARFGASALAIGLAGLAATALSVFLAPAMLAGLTMGDIFWHEAGDQIVPPIVRLPRFLEEGGWLMLGLLTGALCMGATHWLVTRLANRP